MADYVVSQRDHDHLRRLVQEQSRELKNLTNRLTELGVRGHHGTQYLRLYQVRNNTGAERRRGDCVEVEGYLMQLPDDRLDYLRLWQNGETPDESRHFAILDAILPDGQKGAAFVHGTCFAYVNIQSAAHEFANVASGQHVLQSAESGPVRILHKNTSGTGERECVVVFTGSNTAGMHVAKVPPGGIPERSSDAPGSATCSIYQLNTGSGNLIDTGLTQTVKNFYPTAYEFDSDDPYIAILLDRYGQWYCEDPPAQDEGSETTYARFIGFTISNTTGGLMKANNDEMLATLDYKLLGETPPLDGNGELLVHDDQEVCPNALAGGSGWAVRNDNLGSGSPYYQILVCNQMCRQARAVLDATLDGQFEVAIRNFFPDDESPEGLDAIEPFRSRAFNPHRRMARNGSRVLLRWGTATPGSDPFGIPRQGYIIEDVQRFALELPVNFRLNPTTKKLEVQHAEFAVELSIDEIANQPWTEMFPTKDC